MLKVGMFTSGYQRNPLEHCFMDAKEYGYDYIELWGGRPHAYAPDLKAGDINEVRRLIEKYEMPVLGYTPEHNAYPYNYMRSGLLINYRFKINNYNSFHHLITKNYESVFEFFFER